MTVLVIKRSYPDRVFATHTDDQLSFVRGAYPDAEFEVRQTGQAVDVPLSTTVPVPVPEAAVAVASVPTYDALAATVVRQQDVIDDLERRLRVVEGATIEPVATDA